MNVVSVKASCYPALMPKKTAAPAALERPNPEQELQARAAGALLRQKRLDKGLSLQGVADRLEGVHKTYLSLLELGRYNAVRSKHLPALMDVLGITVAEIREVAPDLVVMASATPPPPVGQRRIVYAGTLGEVDSRKVMTTIGDDPQLSRHLEGDLLSASIEDTTLVQVDGAALFPVGAVVVWSTMLRGLPDHWILAIRQDGVHAVMRSGQPDAVLAARSPSIPPVRAGTDEWKVRGAVLQTRVSL